MSGIPEATPIILTEAERAELEGLARSSKTEYRLRQRARIVLLAADGMASRAIGRTVRCTIGTASKWRVRYAEKRLAGLDETGDRGAELKYTAATGKRILALLEGPHANRGGCGLGPGGPRRAARASCLPCWHGERCLLNGRACGRWPLRFSLCTRSGAYRWVCAGGSKASSADTAAGR